ncbi:hypothetical protein GCM10023231_41040 [Olivibacter ginsenosidimutans]|uniref:DUF4175 domain-containing protein n=1 Tax=Olivibacter ginsenosidimutans TaxID=1176537 RepID=A0ABP9CFU3_9SPHI
MNFKTPFLRLWGIPILLALATLVGLLAALIGDGLWDALSWLLLSSLVLVLVYYIAKANRKA